jgi:hypothetical protein
MSNTVSKLTVDGLMQKNCIGLADESEPLRCPTARAEIDGAKPGLDRTFGRGVEHTAKSEQRRRGNVV